MDLLGLSPSEIEKTPQDELEAYLTIIETTGKIRKNKNRQKLEKEKLYGRRKG